MERPRTKRNAQVYDEASSWFVECRAGDLDEAGRREFDSWLRASPEHLSAYLEVAAIWNEGPALDPNRKWDADTLIAESRKDRENVVSLGGTSAVLGLESSVPAPSAVPSLEPRRSIPRRRFFTLAASLVGLAALGGLWAYFALSSGIYSTAIGEQRSIELADGSTVSMNSRSKIRVRYSTPERAVDLLEGQALFHVAKDGARPFIVTADDTRVRAVGTQFDVYERRAGTVVTVMEGQVAVLTPSAANVAPSSSGTDQPNDVNAAPIATILVSAGEQLTVTPKVAKKSEHANVAAATAWTQRQIIFESATLSEVAEEFNRYNERQLVIEDPDSLPFHVSGVFSSTDPESLIRFLRERPGVRVVEEGSVIRISQKI